MVVNYRTVDGTAVAGDAPGVAGDNDYEAVDSSFTFFPQTATPGQWTSRAITHNATNDYDYSVSGDAVVFEAIDPKNGDWDISVYCHEIGMPPLLLTDAAYQAAYGTTDERFGDVQRIKTATQNAIYVVWSGWDGNDYEIFFAEVEVDVAAHSLSVVRTAQLTDNAYDDLSPQISESHIAWSSANASGKHDIYVQPIATIGTQAPQKISSSDYDSYDPEISGDKIVWHAKTVQARTSSSGTERKPGRSRRTERATRRRTSTATMSSGRPWKATTSTSSSTRSTRSKRGRFPPAAATTSRRGSPATASSGRAARTAIAISSSTTSPTADAGQHFQHLRGRRAAADLE